jgi:hypothetical protein
MKTISQSFIVLSVLALSASVQATPAPVQAAPVLVGQAAPAPALATPAQAAPVLVGQAAPAPAPVAPTPVQATPAPFQETPELGQTTIYRGVPIVLTKRAKSAYESVRQYRSPGSRRQISPTLPTEEYEKIYARQQELKKENPQISFSEMIKRIDLEDAYTFRYKEKQVVITRKTRDYVKYPQKGGYIVLDNSGRNNESQAEADRVLKRQEWLKAANPQMSFWDIVQKILEEDIQWIPYKGTLIVKTRQMSHIQEFHLIKSVEKRQLDKECERVYQMQQQLRQQNPGISLYEMFKAINSGFSWLRYSQMKKDN